MSEERANLENSSNSSLRDTKKLIFLGIEFSISDILALCSAVSIGIAYLINFTYSKYATTFYNIPSDYFEYNNFTSLVILIAIFLIFASILIFASKYINQNSDFKDRLINVLTRLFVISLLLFLAYLPIYFNTFHLNSKFDYVYYKIIQFIFIIIIVLFCLVLYGLLIVTFSNNSTVWSFLVGIIIFIVGYIFYSKSLIDPQDKTKYEIATNIESNKKFIVVSRYKNFLVAIPYCLCKDKSSYYIKRDTYQLLKPDKYILKYEDLNLTEHDKNYFKLTYNKENR